MSAADDPRAQAFTDEEFRAAVDEAHRHGRKVTVHAIGTGGIKAALRAGVDCIEHGLLLDEEAITMMKQRGVPLVPTIYVLDYIIEQGETACCYAKSEKSWIDDPAGIAWETFHTTGESTVYGDGTGENRARVAHEKQGACCVPQPTEKTASACC